MYTPGVLATIPGSTDDERLLLVLHRYPERGVRLELCQQTWGEGIGWFTQKNIELSPQQASALRSALGSGPPAVRTVRAECTELPALDLRLWRAESA